MLTGFNDFLGGFGSALTEGFGGILGGIGDLFGGLFDFLGNMLTDLFSFFKPLIDFVSWIMEFLGGLISGIGNFVWSLFEGAINLIIGGITTIVDWVGSFFSFLGNLLKDLFVPEDTYFKNNTNSLNNELKAKLGTEEYTNTLNSLTRVSRAGLNDIKANLFGLELTIIPLSLITPIIPTIQNWTRGFMFVFIILWQVNNVYKLIRGTSFINFNGTKGGKE